MEFFHTLPDAVKLAIGMIIGAGFLGVIFGFVLFKAGDGFKSWSTVLGTSSTDFIKKFSDVAELSKRLSEQEAVLKLLKELPTQIEHLRFVTETAIGTSKQHGDEMSDMRRDMSHMERTSLSRIEAIEKDVRDQLRVLLAKVLELAK